MAPLRTLTCGPAGRPSFFAFNISILSLLVGSGSFSMIMLPAGVGSGEKIPKKIRHKPIPNSTPIGIAKNYFKLHRRDSRAPSRMPRPATAAPPAATFLTVSSGLGESKRKKEKTGEGTRSGRQAKKAEERGVRQHCWRASFGSLASILAGLPRTHSVNSGAGNTPIQLTGGQRLKNMYSTGGEG